MGGNRGAEFNGELKIAGNSNVAEECEWVLCKPWKSFGSEARFAYAKRDAGLSSSSTRSIGGSRIPVSSSDADSADLGSDSGSGTGTDCNRASVSRAGTGIRFGSGSNPIFSSSPSVFGGTNRRAGGISTHVWLPRNSNDCSADPTSSPALNLTVVTGRKRNALPRIHCRFRSEQYLHFSESRILTHLMCRSRHALQPLRCLILLF